MMLFKSINSAAHFTRSSSGCLSDLLMMQDSVIPDAAIELKEKANTLFRKLLFSDALSVYQSILDRFDGSIPAPFTRVVRCNIAACFIELRRYENALNHLDLIFLASTSGTIPKHEQEGDPIFQKAHFRKARCLFELGSFVLALDSLNAYKELVKGKVDDTEPPLRAKIMQRILKAAQSVESDQNIRPVRYEIHLDGHDKPFVKHSTVPSDLCCRIPPRDRGIAFIVRLMETHEPSILNSQPGGCKCWNCGKPATTLAHTPQLHLEVPPEEGGPLVQDYVHPICTRGGDCEELATKKMRESNFRFRSRDVLPVNNYALYSALNGYGPPL